MSLHRNLLLRRLFRRFKTAAGGHLVFDEVVGTPKTFAAGRSPEDFLGASKPLLEHPVFDEVVSAVTAVVESRVSVYIGLLDDTSEMS
jgi:hypothetical protein